MSQPGPSRPSGSSSGGIFSRPGSSSMAGPFRGGLAGPSSSSRPQEQKPLESTRLFIGNLSPSVDEYTLIQVFSKAGRIAKMDYLFHKTGPLKGKPRGYAFVEYSTKEEAQKAIDKLHDRVFRGKSLVVTPASVSNYDASAASGKPYRRHDPAKTTTLSLLKNKNRPHSAEAQIKALEAKLNAMKHSPLATASASAPVPGETGTGTSAGGSVEHSAGPATRSGSEALEEGASNEGGGEAEAEAFMSEMQAEIGGGEQQVHTTSSEEEARQRWTPTAPATAPPRPTLNPPPLAAGLPQRPSRETLDQARHLAKQSGS